LIFKILKLFKKLKSTIMKNALIFIIIVLPLILSAQNKNNKTTVVIDGGGVIKTEIKFNNSVKISNQKTPNKSIEPISEAQSKNTSSSSSSGNSNSSSNTMKVYSKYDFVAGEKVVALEDFSQSTLGDFPLRWNTNGSAEVVNLDGQNGNWLEIAPKTTLLPEFINSLPENFTLEFDLACSQPFSLYTQEFFVGFVTMQKPSVDFAQWTTFKRGTSGFILGLHPLYAISKTEGVTNYKIIEAGKEVIKNKVNQGQFNQFSKPVVHVAIWRQNDRVRIYLNEDKVWDLPKAFANTKHNGVVFYSGGAKTPDNRYYISNLRLAVGSPDTRKNLLDQGRFSTNGILFDVNSDKIKPASYGILKEIASTLKEMADIRVNIIGHTDSDGDDASNLILSKKRADAVKKMLVEEFGIDAKRLETDGKGETQPIDKNTSPESKANNRRVEFIKL
jgi:OOP family OmpA-OmpF porin